MMHAVKDKFFVMNKINISNITLHIMIIIPDYLSFPNDLLDSLHLFEWTVS